MLVSKTDNFVGLLQGMLGSNPACTRLTVRCPTGTFSTLTNIVYSGNVSSSQGGTTLRLRFHVVQSQFDVTSPGTACYWVLPLVNFVSDYARSRGPVDRHPLRIYPTPPIPPGLSGKDLFLAELRAFTKNNLINFNYDGHEAFIEPLPDYDERKSMLENGRASHLTTAIMVGELASRSIEHEAVKSWFPIGILPLLSMISGNEVGNAWFEFRDKQGDLVRRLHMPVLCPSFSKGPAFIEEIIHQGTGALLSAAMSLAELTNIHLQLALRNLVRSRGGGHGIEWELGCLFRALEALLNYYDVPADNSRLVLPPEIASLVKDKLKLTADDILGMAKVAGEQEDDGATQILRQVALQVKHAHSVRPGFGKRVALLLKRIALADCEALSAHGKPDWPQHLSRYRGIVMHGEYIKEEEMHYAWALANHLRDIVARVLLRTFRYNGTYQPCVCVCRTKMPLDWVTASTDLQQLGYAPQGLP